MPLPNPEPGLVIPYVYLRRREFEAGEETGRKVRPGLIIVVIVKSATGAQRVAVCPITTQAPDPTRAAIEVQRRVRAHLGLNAAKSWIICDDYNEFDWPGVDLGLTPKCADHFGYAPDALINRARQEVFAARVSIGVQKGPPFCTPIHTARARGVPRTELERRLPRHAQAPCKPLQPVLHLRDDSLPGGDIQTGWPYRQSNTIVIWRRMCSRLFSDNQDENGRRDRAVERA